MWLPAPTRPVDQPVPGSVAGDPAVRVALGDMAGGPAGFVTAHRQARAAYEVGLVAGPEAGPVFPYREVSGLAFLCADLPRARAWVAETLAGLAAPGPRVAELRRTVRA